MRRACLILLALGWFSASLLSAERVCFETRLAESQPESDDHAVLRLTSHGPESSVATGDREIRVTVPGRARFEIGAGLWRAQLESTKFWSEPQWVRSGETPKREPEPCIQVKVYPVARLSGRIEGDPLPNGRFEVRFSGSPAEPAAARVPRGQVTCPVDSERRFSCAVPAGRVNLRLHTSGFIPFYSWDLSLEAAKPHDLGVMSWQKGASVVGWIELARGERVPGKTVLELSPQVEGGESGWEQARRQTHKVEANARGFFQFPQVAPGLYRLTAGHPDFTAPRVFPVEVRRDLETEIARPLQLSPPVSVSALVEPPRAPDGSAWKVELEPRHEGNFLPSQDFFPGVPGEPGLWRFAGLAPGPYQLLVRGEDSARWWKEEVEITAGMAPLSVEIPLVPVRGRVLLGDEPLAARLMFGGLFGADRKIPFSSDEEGHFEGLLPGEGDWKVDLVGRSPFLRMNLTSVEVRRRQGKSYAEVEIRLPDTLLQGEVVDEEEKPLPEARVWIQVLGERADQLRADEKGKFEIRGLPSGPAALKAEAGERTSDWVQTALREEDENGTAIRLVARRKLKMEGRVMAAAGGRPVAGARLMAWPAWDAGAAVPVLTGTGAVSGPRGDFSLSLPAGIAAVNIVTMAPGFPLQMRRLILGPSNTVEIQLAAEGGTLVVDLGGTSGSLASFVLMHGGTDMALGGPLEEWRRLNQAEPRGPGLWVLPQLEPGDYALCRSRAAWEAVSRGGTPPEGACTAGLLVPMGELILSAPPEREEKSAVLSPAAPAAPSTPH